jgi:hypothetical protein
LAHEVFNISLLISFTCIKIQLDLVEQPILS